MSRAPKHLWIVGGLALLWSLLGAANHLLLVTENRAYTSQFTEEQLAHGRAIPAWLSASWAIAAWGGVLGSALLLLRRKVAPFLLAISALAWAAWAIGMGVFTDLQLALPFAFAAVWAVYARMRSVR